MTDLSNAPYFTHGTLINPDMSISNGEVFFSLGEFGGRRSVSEDEFETKAGHLGALRVWPAGEAFEIQRHLIDYAAGTVTDEDGKVSSFNEFIETAIRTDLVGNLIIPASALPNYQVEAIRRHGGDELHLNDLANFVDSLRDSATPRSQTAIGMYDIIVNSQPDQGHDGPTDGQEVVRISQNAREFFDDLAGFSLGHENWTEAGHISEFSVPEIRGMFRHFMARYIGDYPLDFVMRTQAFPETLQTAFDATCELVSVDEPFGAEHIIRGYRTSEVRHYRGSGVDTIVFSDMGGSYAYAWATDPELINTPAASL